MSEPFLTIANNHTDSCGEPPNIRGGSGSGCYIGYFENEYGEQAVFVYRYATKECLLYMGDAGWEEARQVINGVVPGLSLNKNEQIWVDLCWKTATGDAVVVSPNVQTWLDGLSAYPSWARNLEETQPEKRHRIRNVEAIEKLLPDMHLPKVGSKRLKQEFLKLVGRHLYTNQLLLTLIRRFKMDEPYFPFDWATSLYYLMGYYLPDVDEETLAVRAHLWKAIIALIGVDEAA